MPICLALIRSSRLFRAGGNPGSILVPLTLTPALHASVIELSNISRKFVFATRTQVLQLITQAIDLFDGDQVEMTQQDGLDGRCHRHCGKQIELLRIRFAHA